MPTRLAPCGASHPVRWLDYLEGDGSQWIQTDTIDDPANNIAQVVFSITASTGATMGIAGSNSYRFNYMNARWHNSGREYRFGPNSNTSPVLSISVGDKHTGSYTLENGQLVYTLDGASTTYAQTLVYDDKPFGIFKIPNTSASALNGRIYGFTVIRKSDGAILANYRPVAIGNAGYMYDLVSGKYFGNAGTGAFGLGEKVSANSYLLNGAVGMWNGIENAGWGVHDPNATVWKDLIGNNDQSVSGGSGWLSNAYSWADDTETYRMFGGGSIFQTGTFTLEALVSRVRQYSANFPGIGNAKDEAPFGFRSNAAVAGCGFRAYGVRFGTVAPTTAIKKMTLVCSDGKLKAYLNGAYLAETDHDSSVSMAGGLYWSEGILYSCTIYNRALAAAEIAANYAVDVAYFNLPTT